jgi:16S rRNA (uracil1498-N3)-methyltransferase
MSTRYFSEAPITSDSVTLMGPEAHHLSRVMRVRGGELVTLFDGSGCEFAARVERIERQAVQLAILSRQEVDREAAVAIELGIALPKGDRQAWLVEKAVELGIGGLTPLTTQRGVAQPVEKALLRLRRGVIESSKQCGRNKLMEIRPPQSLQEFLQRDPVALRWLAHPGGRAVADAMIARNSQNPVRAASLAIGPEGGFSDDEVAAARTAGWEMVDLGPRILRVETAAIALTALIAITR